MRDFWFSQVIEKTRTKPLEWPESGGYSSRATYNSKLDTSDKYFLKSRCIVQKGVQS